MKLDRKKVSISKLDKSNFEKAAHMTGAERLSFVWEITKKAYSVNGKFDDNERLQRNVVSIIRPKS